MSPAITPGWFFPETDRSAFGKKVYECLGDRRIAGYFARKLVQHDDVMQALLDGEAFDQAVSRNSYQPYSRIRKLLKGTLRQNADILDEDPLNGRTILVCAPVVLLALALLVTFCVGHFATFGIMLGAVLSAALSARLFGKARIEPQRRPRNLAFSFLAFSISLCIIILPHFYLGLRWTSFGLYLSWALALTAGYQLHNPQTAGEFKDLLIFGGNYLSLYFDKREYSRFKREWLDDCVETVIIPNAVLAINEALGEDKDRLLVEQGSEGLRKLQDPSFTVSTSSESRIASMLSQMDGGSIALAGPRGAGKSTLLKKFSDPQSGERINARIPVYLAAPAEYVPRDFIAELFQRLCEAYLNYVGCPLPGPIYKEPTFKFRRVCGRVLGTLWLIFRTAVALGIIAWLVWPFIKTAYPHVYLSSRSTFTHWYNVSHQDVNTWWAQYKLPCQIGLLVVVMILLPGPKLWRNYIRPPGEPPLAKKAREYLQRLQIDKTTTWGTTLTSPRIRGMTFSANRGGTASYTPWTLPELVRHTRLFLENISRQFPDSSHAVIVGIDEIDRIGSVDHAEKFIGEIKAIFGVERCFFMVAVAEDVGSVFSQRATAGRSILENAFDDIVVVEPLNFEETRNLLLKRVPGFTDSFVYLAYSLSGGLPRELIRVTRRLVEANQELASADRQPRLQDLAFILVKENLIESIRVTRAQISRFTLHANWTELFKDLRSASTDLRNTSSSSTHQSYQIIEELSELKAPSPSAKQVTANINSDDEEAAVRIIQSFSAYAYFGLTVIDAFSEKFFNPQIMQRHAIIASETAYEELALARAELSVSSASSRVMLSRFRNSLRPRETRPDVAVNDPSLPVPSRHSGRVPDSGDLLSCSFCGKSQKRVKKLIAGPDVYICDSCISGAHAVIAKSGRTARTPIATVQQVSDEGRTEQCNFCRKHRYEVVAMASGGDVRICNECLEVCDEILSEEPSVPSR